MHAIIQQNTSDACHILMVANQIMPRATHVILGSYYEKIRLLMVLATAHLHFYIHATPVIITHIFGNKTTRRLTCE